MTDIAREYVIEVGKWKYSKTVFLLGNRYELFQYFSEDSESNIATFEKESLNNFIDKVEGELSVLRSNGHGVSCLQSNLNVVRSA